MRVVVDREACMGFGRCIEVLPDVFSLDQEGKVVVGSVSNVDRKMLQMAVWSCPRQAIQLLDDAGEKLPEENG